MNISTMSSMLRSASIKARVIAEAGARTLGRQLRRSFAESRVLSQLHADEHFLSRINEGDRESRPRRIPQPLPAVAYDYRFHWEEDESGSNDSATTCNQQGNKEGLTPINETHVKDVCSGDVTGRIGPISLVSGRNQPPGTNKPYPSPSSVDRNGKPITGRKSSGGGGGGGRHRCPKCGTYTIFSHNEFGNSFYCATCSGWFTAAETLEGEDNLLKVRGNGKITKDDFFRPASNDPSILYQHVRMYCLLSR
jgi:hypothetical protein